MRGSRLHYLLATLTAVTVLVPQRGDPRPDPVTHPEWARMMLRGLDLTEALDFVTSASRAFAVLSWRQNESLDARQFIPRSAHGVVVDARVPPSLRSVEGLGEVSFPVTVARAGEYRLRVRMAGDPAIPAGVEVVPLAGGEGRSLTLVPLSTPGWIEAPRPLRLHPGAYRATFALPLGALFERLEVAPRCVPSIEPIGGWRTIDTLDAEDLAVTLVRALDRERELPPAELPIEALRSLPSEPEARVKAGARLETGGRAGRVVVSVEAPVDGLYSLSALGVRTAGQRWAVDDCRSAVTCPLPSRLPTWFPVLTVPLSAGRHRFSADFDPGDAIDRVRLERRKDSGQDYVDVVRRMGFDPGVGPVSHEKAEEALAWLHRRHRIELSEICYEPGMGPALQQAVLRPPSWSTPPAEPPATLPCQPPSSPVETDPCRRR